jgi:hypothetical protein
MSSRSVFFKLFSTSTFGFGFKKAGAGKRVSSEQSQFRQNLIKSSNARHPNPKSSALWCPISGQYHMPELIVAGHIFAYHHGQDILDAIFGLQETPELFSEHNGILMLKAAEERIDKGPMMIVPDIPNKASIAQAKDWHNTEPKNYKIRVLEFEKNGMDQCISVESDTTWAELDGRRLDFLTNQRPRARYLYFLYCSTMLRRSWSTVKAAEVLRDDLGRVYWGTAGSYMHKNQLLGFVERMGHEYEDLLQGAIEEETDDLEVDETALAAATNQIILSNEDSDPEEEDEDEDDDDDDDEDDDEDD